MIFTLLGMDSSLNGVFWRGDLLFTVYWNDNVPTLYNQTSSTITVTPTNVRSDGGLESSTMTATATALGSAIIVQVTGPSSFNSPSTGAVNWNCIAQLQWMN